MVFSGDSGNDTQIASLSIGTSLDVSGIWKDLKRLDRVELPELQLKPTVDFTQIHKLNDQFDLKVKHLGATNRKLKLKPTADLTSLVNLHKGLDTINRDLAKFHRQANTPIDLTFKATGLDAIEKRIAAVKRNAAIDLRVSGGDGRPGTGRSGSSGQSDSRLAQQIGAEVGKVVKSGGIGKAIGGAVQLPFKLATGAISEVGKSLLFGVSQEVTKGFGKGLNNAIERSISGSIGSTELAGESIGDALSKGLVDAINKRVPGALSEVQDALKDALGEDAITKAGLFGRSQQRKEQQRKVSPVREQATIERRDLLRERMGVQNRVQSVQGSIASVQSEYQRGEQLRTRLQNQSLREQMLGASPQRLAQFDATIGSLNKQLDALSQQERDLNDVLASVTQELDSFDKRLEQSKKTVARVAPEETPLAYRQAIERVAGRKVSESQMPRLVVADEKLRARGSRASYGIESNTLQITQEMKDALDAGKLTIDQMETLFHELQHAMQYSFGSFQGVQANREGQILTKPTQATASELREIAPLINQYDPRERLSEVDAEIQGRRNARSAFTQQQRQSAIGNLYQSVGYGGANVQNIASKQIDATSKQLQSIRNLADQLGLDVDNSLGSITDSFKRIAGAIEDLSNQSVQLDDLDPTQIEGLEGQFKAQFKALTDLQSIVDRFQSQFVQRGRAVQQGQQIKTQAQQQLDGVRSILDTVSKRSFDLNVAVGQRFGEIQEAYEMLSENLSEVFQEASQQSDITPESMQQTLAGSIDGIAMLQEAAASYQTQFEKRVKATKFGRGVRSTVQSVGNAAQTAGGVIGSGMRNLNDVLQSPQGQALVKGLNAATRSVGMVAKSGYKLAEGFESLALDLMPAGRLIKGTLQQTVVPAALFGAATHLLPGGEAAAQGLVHLAQSAGNPLLESASSGMAGQAVDFIQSAVPHVMGLQNTIASAATQAIESGVSTVGGLVIQAGTVVLGGKALQTAATLPLKAATGQEPLPMLLPGREREKETIALPAASGRIAKQQKAEIEQSNKELAKKAAYRAGLTTRQALDSATKTIDTIAQSVKSGTAATSDAVAQAKTIGTKFTQAYSTFKEQSKKGNTQLAKAHAQTILDISEQAVKEIDKLIKDLKSEGVDTNFAKSLGGTLQGIKGQIVRKQNLTRTYVEKNPSVTPYIDVSASNELESQRLQMPKISQEQIADLGVNLVGAITSQIAGQHGIVAELAGDLIGALGARTTYQVGKAGANAYKGVKRDPAYAAMNSLDKFSKLMNQISLELQSDFVQKEFGNQLTGDLAGFAIGNATRLAANTVDSISGIPLKGAAAAMLTVPQIQKLREQVSSRIAIEQGGSPELESQRLDLNKVRGGKGLSEDELNQLKALNKLLEEAEAAADRADAALGQIGKGVDRAFNQSQQGLDQALQAFEDGEESANQTSKALFGLGNAGKFVLAGFLGFQAIGFVAPMLKSFATESLQAAREFEQFERTLKFVTGTADRASDTLAGLREESNRLGVDLRTSIRGQTQLMAATRGTSLEGEATEQIGSAARQAASVYGLNAEQTDRLNLAIQQMASKGKVSAEELRQQLGEVLPGAFQIFARSIGVTAAQLDGMLQRGEVGTDALVKFANQLTAETSTGVAGAANSAQASLNRFNNSVYELQVAFGQTLLPAQSLGLNALTQALQILEKLLPVITTAIGAFGAKLGLSLGASLLKSVTGFTSLQGVLLNLPGAIRSVSAVIAPFVAQFAVFAMISDGFAVLNKRMSDAGGASRAFADSASKGLQEYLELTGQAVDETTRLANALKNMPESYAEGTLGGGIVKGIMGEDEGTRYLRQREQDIGRSNPFARFLFKTPVIGDIAYGLSEGAGYRPQGDVTTDRFYAPYSEKRGQDVVEANQEGVAQAQKMITELNKNLQEFNSGSGNLQEIRSLDEQARDLQSRRSLLPADDTAGRRAIDEQYTAIIKAREELAAGATKLQSELTAQIEGLESANKGIEEALKQGGLSPQTQKALERQLEINKKLIEDSRVGLEGYAKAINIAIESAAKLQVKFEAIVSALEILNTRTQTLTAQSQTEVLRGQLSGNFTPGQVQSLQSTAEQQGLAKTIENLNKTIDSLDKLITNPATSRALTMAGLDPNTDALTLNNRLAEMRNEGVDVEGEDFKTLQGLQQQLNQRDQLKLQVAQSQQQLVQSQVQARESLRDANRQIAEYYRSIQRASEDTAATVANMQAATKIQSIKNEFQANLTGFSDSFFGDMWGGINELFELAQRRIDLVNDASQRERENQRNAEDQVRGGSDLRRSTYGGSGLPGTVEGQALAELAIGKEGTQFRAGVAEQCANFVRDIFAQAGIDLGVTSAPVDGLSTGAALANSFFGEDIGVIIRNPEDLMPGDIVGYANTYGDWEPGTITHAAVYAGNGMIVDRSTSGGDVNYRPLDTFDMTNFVGVRPHALANGTPQGQALQASSSSSSQPTPVAVTNMDAMFSGGSNSPIAQIIGRSEGTRTAGGGFTEAYGGHTDPGNAAHNMGSFSYQGGASSPEAADAAWLEQMKDVLPQFISAAQAAGLDPNDPRLLMNFLDLYTQSPAAATASGGFLDQLPRIANLGISDASIVEARTRSYIDPATGQLDAPGFGNNPDRLLADQQRRVSAVGQGVGEVFGGGGISTAGVATADTSRIDAGQSQALANANALNAANQEKLQADLRFADIQEQQTQRRIDRARQQGVRSVQQQNTEMQRSQLDLTLQGYSDLPAAQVVSQLTANTRGLDDTTIQNQLKLQEMSDRIADFEVLVENAESSPGFLEVLGGAEELEKYKQSLSELYPEFERLKTLVDSETSARSTAQNDILESYRRQQAEQQRSLDLRTEELEIQRQVQGIRDPELQQLAQFRVQRSGLTRQLESDTRTLNQEIERTVQFIDRMKAEGFAVDSAEVVTANEQLEVLQQRLDSVEGNYQIELDILGTDQLRAIQEFQMGQQESIVQAQSQYYQNQFSPFESNRVQREFATQQQGVQYQQELASINALEQQSMGQPGFDASTFDQMRSSAEQLNSLNLDNLRSQFQSVGDSINQIAIEGFGSLTTGISDIILNGGKLTDVFDQVSKSIINSLVQMGTQFLQSQLYQLFFPQQGGMGATGGSGMGGLFGSLLGGASSLSGASLGSSGISAGGRFSLGGASGGGGFNWGSLLQVGMSFLGGMDTGGPIASGYGGGDKHPFLGEAGEFVLRKEAVKALGGLAAMETLNNAHKMPKFATGGMVGGMPLAPKIPRSPVAPSMPTMPRDAGMSDRGSEPIEVKYTKIGDRDYVERDELDRAMQMAAKQGAQGGRDMAFRAMQQSPNTRRGLGMQ